MKNCAGFGRLSVIYPKEDINTRSSVPDAKKYIYPQKKYADFIISYFDPTLKTCLDVFSRSHSLHENIVKLYDEYRRYY